MDPLESKLWDVVSSNALMGVSDARPEISLSELGINSLNYLKIIVTLEDEFGIEFTDDELSFERLKTLGDLAGLIRAKVEK